MKKIPCLFSIIFITVFIVSCHSNDVELGESFNLSTLRIGLKTSEDEKTILKKYGPLFKYLSEELKIPVTLLLSKTDEKLFEVFKKGQIDLAYFTAKNFMKANLWVRAVPLVVSDIDANASSYFFAKGDGPGRDLSDFSGKNICFGPKSSTATYLIPRYFLEEKGINPESFFGSIKYSKTNLDTVNRIKDGVVDIGVIDSKEIGEMHEDDLLKDLKVVWKTPTHTSHVWALNPYYTTTVQKRIKGAFIALSLENETHQGILAPIRTGSFVEAKLENFSALTKTR